ncbi:MAG: hypothetical protein HN577_02665, partial [Rhodospirillaceae bacterium]|nr:hypothetical protein [Rhodospirillaceae bacterium]
GSWFSYKDTRIGQGRENSKQFLRDHPEMSEEIEQAIRANAGLVAEEMMSGPEPDEAIEPVEEFVDDMA